MRTFLCVLCVAMCSRIAIAQEHGSNFDACVSEAKQRHTDSVTASYFSYKCDGATAQRLAARPDQCAADVRPSRNGIERTSRQMDDGLYLRMIWRTGVCAGMCETRFYNDARETGYLCEVRRHIVGVPDGSARYLGYSGYVDEYAPGGWVYRPVRGYEQTYPSAPRLSEPEPDPRPIGRWIYREQDGNLLEYGRGFDYRRYDPYRRRDDSYGGYR